jgi:hypothetical protein
MTTKSLVTTLTVVLVLGTTALTEETRAQRTRPDCPPPGTNLRAAVAAGQLTAEEARACANRDYRARAAELRDPAEFTPEGGERLFSGPQPGETLPPLKVAQFAGQEYDPVALAGQDPQILMFGGGRVLGRIQGPLARHVQTIANESGTTWHMSMTYLSDDQFDMAEFAALIAGGIPEFVRVGYSQDGRDGPGAWGFNRNVPVTIIIAKDGKVTHNFAYAQDFFFGAPHVLGAIAEVIGEDRETVAAWLEPRD